MHEYLSPTPVIDSDHPAVIQYAKSHTRPGSSEIEQAVDLYYAVRDGFRYDPYRLDLTVAGIRASATVQSGHGWCVSKAVLLAACCRAIGIPARLGFADVKNHLSTERLRQAMQTDVFHWHGYTSMQLAGRWVKATPAFNRELCDKFQMGRLEFDGRQDSLYHPFDLTGQRHMEYLRDRGEFADLPLQQITADFQRVYANLINPMAEDFDADVKREMSN
jgi:transglutaminase-like putative cysteine protease